MSNKFIALTSDNATNNVKGIKLLQNWLIENNFSSIHHIRCLAHILNLSVRAGISVLKSELDDVRRLFNFIKLSPKYTQLLQEKCQVLNIKYLKPKVDVETRWNSTYDMLERAIKLKLVLTFMAVQDNKFRNRKINETTWEVLELLKEFLKPFYGATVLIFGSNYPTINIVIPIYQQLFSHLNSFNTENLNIKSCMEKIKSKLCEYEVHLKNDFAIFASILDPRLKYEFFEETDTDFKYKRKCEQFYEKYKKEFAISDNDCDSNEQTLNFKQTLFKRKRLETPKQEINIYLSMPLKDESCGPIIWWKNHQKSFPILSKIMFDLISIPATSVPSEQVFSKAGNLISKKLNRLEKNTVKTLMLLNSWNKYFDKK